jgi:hypothetical protein
MRTEVYLIVERSETVCVLNRVSSPSSTKVERSEAVVKIDNLFIVT